MQIDLATLKNRILEATKRFAIATEVEDVVLEPDRDDEGTDFLRVVVQLKSTNKAGDTDFEALLEAIEGAVSAVDERYASVRFADAA